MSEMNDLFKSSWGAEKWIAEGWDKITREERALIKQRMDDLFRDGIPEQLNQHRLVYVYIFSLLAQLEVLAIQVPLRFESRLTKPEFKAMMRQQLLDEIFHGLVFTKIAHELSAPYAQPPAYNEKVEILCDFIFKEEDPKVAVVLLNLVCEGWIEEVFKMLRQHGVAPEIFDVILEDEHRHVCEADLYRELGLPDLDKVMDKLNFLEEHLINDVIFQPNYTLSLIHVWGITGNAKLLHTIDNKHRKQLAKIKLTPGTKWQFFMSIAVDFNQSQADKEYKKVKLTPTRRILMTEWNDPRDPTITSMVDVDISAFGYFENRYNKGLVTLIMAQALSQMMLENDSYRRIIKQQEQFQYDSPRIGIVAKSPGKESQLFNIVFENCHEMSFTAMAKRLRRNMSFVNFCNKKCNELTAQYPHLSQFLSDIYLQTISSVFGLPRLGNSVVSLSDVIRWDWTTVQSPLRPGEILKYTLCNVTKKQVWDQQTSQFVAKDIMAVAASGDHRVVDGNTAPPAMIQKHFDDKFAKFLEQQPGVDSTEMIEVGHFSKLVDQLLCYDLELGFKLLVFLRNSWPDHLNVPELLKNKIHELVSSKAEMA